MDAKKVREKKIQYVLFVRAVLRELGAIDRTEENLEAMTQIEQALNGSLDNGDRERAPNMPGLVHA